MGVSGLFLFLGFLHNRTIVGCTIEDATGYLPMMLILPYLFICLLLFLNCII